MSQRFVIDINVNGGGQGTGGREGGAALAAGIGAGLLRNEGPYQGTLSPRSKDGNDYAVRYKSKSWMNRADYEAAELEASGYGTYGGKLISFGTRRMIGGYGIEGVSGGLQEQETLFGFGLRKTGDWAANHSKQIKGLGAAAAWKAAGSTLELVNYTSGDSAANKQRAMGMKMATYGAAIMATGGNPLVIAGIVGNELISAGVDAYKYSHDRKMERGRIMNMATVAGDISYGRRRGGR